MPDPQDGQCENLCPTTALGVGGMGTTGIYMMHYVTHVTLERFSFECRKTKTKVITLTNHDKGKQRNEPIRIQSKYDQ